MDRFPELTEVLIALFVGIGVAVLLAPTEFVKRRLGNIDMPLVDQRAHKPEKEGEQQGADMAAVDIRIRHNDDLVVTGFKSGVIIGISLIVTVFGSFLFLQTAGGTMQRVSLAAFVLAMGMLVDNAQTVNTPILISVPNVEMRAWNNAVFSRNSKGLPCMTAGLPTGIIRIENPPASYLHGWNGKVSKVLLSSKEN